MGKPPYEERMGLGENYRKPPLKLTAWTAAMIVLVDSFVFMCLGFWLWTWLH